MVEAPTPSPAPPAPPGRPDAGPAFSVVVPCRDSAAWLPRTLATVAAQTRPPRELIVVDDGSTDDSARIARDAGATVVESGGVGGAAARNRGAAVAAGDWLAFLDADDLWYPDRLERTAALVSRSPGTDVGVLYHFDHVSPDADDRISPRPGRHFVDEPSVSLAASAFVAWFAATMTFPGMSACCVRRSAWEAVGGMDEGQARRHDIELWLRLLTTVPGATWAYDPRASSAYRSGRPGNLSADLAARERFHLTAVTKNLPSLRRLDRPAADRLVRKVALRRLGGALTHGDAAERRAAVRDVRPHLRPRDWPLLAAATVAPGAVASLVRLRRRR